MRYAYKKIVISAMASMLLAACGSNVKEDPASTEDVIASTPSTQTKLAKAQLGVLAGATVKIEELGTVPYKLLFTETTSSGDSIDAIGNFDAHAESYDKNKFYLLSVSGGLDMDANDDGKIDAIPTINKGTFHAIVKGEDAKALKGAFKVTTASELVYKKVKSTIEDTDTLEEKLDESAKEVLQKSTDASVEVNNADILEYDPIKHKEHFQEVYQDRLPELIKDIHDDKKVDLRLAPTANAGIDKSIMIDEVIELKGQGLDLDGKINQFSWSENDEVLSDERSFTYTPATTGVHTLTLTVTDNDGLSGSDRVNITVSQKPNSIPTAKSKTIYVTEDTKRSFTLEGSDNDEDTLTYKILENPVYGQLSGKAPNLTYTPDANFNGDDRIIFVTNDGKADSKKALIKIRVEPSNDKPEILFDGDSITTKEDTPKRFSLKAVDQDKDTLSYDITQKPKSGTLIHKKESFIYTPKVNFYGKDSFVVTVKDGHGGEDSKEISVIVTPVNDAPTVDIGDSKSILAGENLTLKANTKDVDGSIVKYAWKEGSKLLSSDAILNYKQEEIGNHILTLTVTDDKGATATDRVVIHVNESPNEKPKAENISINMDEDTIKNITLKANDADEDKLTYKIIQNPLHGTLSGKAPNLSYAPVKDYFGKDSFTYRANDGKDDSNIAKVSITIADVPEPDKTAPVITLKGSSTITLLQGQTYIEAGAVAKDDKDGTIKVTMNGKVDTTKIGTYTITYTAIDKAGNRSVKRRKVIIKSSDTTPPVIKWWNGEAWENIAKPRTYYINRGHISDEINQAIAIDDKDGKVAVKMSGIDFNKPGTYNVTFTAVDKAGNKAVKYWKITLLPADTKKPDIIFPKGQNITLKEGEKLDINTLGIYSMDDKKGKGHAELREISKDGKKDDGMLGFIFSEDLKRGNAKAGVYKLTYRSIDGAGNKAIEYLTITILDKTPPVITLKGSSTISIIQGEKYTDAGAVAKDRNDGTVRLTTSGRVDTNKIGTYTITYTAVDKAGNKATKTRTVKVIAPTYRVTTAINGNRLTVKWSSFPNISHHISLARPTSSHSYYIKGSQGEKTYTLDQAEYEVYHYALTIREGNKVVFTKKFDLASKKVDKTPPVITLLGSSTVSITQGKTYEDKGALAKDNVDGSLKIVTKSTVDTSRVGTYKVTYTATDKAGNRTVKSRKVIVEKAIVVSIKELIAQDITGRVKYYLDQQGYIRKFSNGSFSDKIGTQTFRSLHGAVTDDGKLFYVYNRQLYVLNGNSIKALKKFTRDASGITALGNKVYFSGNMSSDNYADNDLWVSDGTVAGTKILKDMPVGGYKNHTGMGNELIRYKNKIFFAGYDNGPQGVELWYTDGTTNGTKLFKDIKIRQDGSHFNIGSYPKNFTISNGKLYFFAGAWNVGFELFVTDGTTSGTKIVKDLVKNGDGYPRDLTDFNGELFFTSDEGSSSSRISALFRTKGTAASTIRVATGKYHIEGIENGKLLLRQYVNGKKTYSLLSPNTYKITPYSK